MPTFSTGDPELDALRAGLDPAIYEARTGDAGNVVPAGTYTTPVTSVTQSETGGGGPYDYGYNPGDPGYVPPDTGGSGDTSGDPPSDGDTGAFDLDAFLAGLAEQQQAQNDFFASLIPEGPRAIDEARRLFPWAEDLGLLDLIEAQIKEEASVEEIIAEVRQSTPYKMRFVSILDADGTRRMSEAEYLATTEEYRNVLKDFGMFNPNEDTATHYSAFFEGSIDPNELKDRLTVYTNLDRGSAAVKDAFYVYAGMDVSTDDLYQATVSPEFRNELLDNYDQTVSSQTFDYETYITRATERGMQRTVEVLKDMQRNGLVTGQAVSKLMATDPNFAREIMGALYGSTGPDNRTLNLDELMSSFEYAMLGSAATESGLEMPTLERVEQLRSAGINRAQALRAYGSFAQQEPGLQGMAQRSNLGTAFTQSDFEQAALLGQGSSMDYYQRIVAQEQSLSKGSGTFGYQLDGDRLAQTGRKTTR